jgi:hypothetical protein
MLTAAVSLVVYVAAAFFPGEPAPRYAVFTEPEECAAAVERVRAQGIFVTDCTPVELPAPKRAGA